MTIIPVNIAAGWMPDLTPQDIGKVGGLLVCTNVIPYAKNYYAVNDKVTFNTTALSGTPLQGFYGQASDGTFHNYIGTVTKLYKFDKSNMTDVSKTATTYSGTAWSFSAFGNWLIATNYTEAPQIRKNIDSAAGTLFTDLAGTPPKAKYSILNSGRLILGFLNDGTVYPKRIHWSKLEDVEVWTPAYGVANPSRQDLPELRGVITGLANVGENFAVFGEDSITLGVPDTVFGYRFYRNTILGVGCFFPQSLISIGNLVFFWSKKSIWMWDGQSYPKEIGENHRSAVISAVNSTYSNRMCVTHDPLRSLIIWSWPSAASTGNPDRILVYNYTENKFSQLNITASSIMTGVTGGFNADSDFTTTNADTLTTLNADNINYWSGSDIQLLIVDPADSKIKTLTGAGLQAELETGEAGDSPNVLRILKAYPEIYGLTGTGTVAVKHRYSQLVGQTTSATSTIKSDSTADLRVTDRFHALNMKVIGFDKIGSTIKVDTINVGVK